MRHKNSKKVKSTQITKPQRSKKHKKIKDAELYRSGLPDSSEYSRREELNPKSKVQSVPRGVQEIVKFQENPHLYKRKRKKKKHLSNPAYDGLHQHTEKGMTVPLKPVPNFKQMKHESDPAYFHRIEVETQAVLKKSQFEKKYNVDLDEQSYKDGTFSQQVLTKTKQKYHDRLKQKKVKKLEKLRQQKLNKKNPTGFEHLQDKVEFGDVVMAPPSLMSKPRKATSEGTSRKPGKKSLLLKDILTKSSSERGQAARVVGKTVKRKDQSFAQQRIMDKERDAAISRYRQLKASKLKS